jgi:predicted lipid-binding transport protein (Tim44 family)
MTDITLITGLASLFGCLCMAAVCATQLKEIFTAARPARAQPWTPDFAAQSMRTARVVITPAERFAPLSAAA